MKRFYEDVTIAPLDEEQPDKGWQILLDGKPIRNHDGDAIVAPNYVLAGAIGEEWRAVEDKVDLHRMWLTRLAGGATSLAAAEADKLREDMLQYVDTDLLCYFSDDHALHQLQQEKWEPVLNQLQQNGRLSIVRTVGLMPITQSDETVQAVRILLSALTAYHLVAASRLVGLLGSLWLYLACRQQVLSYDEAIERSFLDEQFQAKKWGEDAEALRARKSKKQEMQILVRYLELLGN